MMVECMGFWRCSLRVSHRVTRGSWRFGTRVELKRMSCLLLVLRKLASTYLYSGAVLKAGPSRLLGICRNSQWITSAQPYPSRTVTPGPDDAESSVYDAIVCVPCVYLPYEQRQVDKDSVYKRG